MELWWVFDLVEIIKSKESELTEDEKELLLLHDRLMNLRKEVKP